MKARETGKKQSICCCACVCRCKDPQQKQPAEQFNDWRAVDVDFVVSPESNPDGCGCFPVLVVYSAPYMAGAGQEPLIR